MIIRRSARQVFLIAAAGIAAILISLASIFPVRPVAAMDWTCVYSSSNLIQNGGMSPTGAVGGVDAHWTKFVLEGNPIFEASDYPGDWDGSQYFYQDQATFDAGIYQTVSNLTPGATYLFWPRYAYAHYDENGELKDGLEMVRQVGVDLTGGTSASSSNVKWGPEHWTVGSETLTIPDLAMSFTAQSSQATIFLRGKNTVERARAKFRYSAVCMEKTADAPVLTHKAYLPLVIAPVGSCSISVVSTVNVGATPKGISADAATNRVFVALKSSSSVGVLNAATNQLIATWGTNSSGHANSVAFANGHLFVSLEDTDSVAYLDASSGSVLSGISVGDRPSGVGASNGKVYVANFDSGTVSVIDATTLGVSTTSNLATGAVPSLVAAASDRAYVTYFDVGVSVIGSGGTILNNFTVTPDQGYGVAVNESTSRLYVSDRYSSSSRVVAVNSTNGSAMATHLMSEIPYGLAVNPTTNHVFVSLPESNKVAVLNGTTLNQIGSLISVGTGGENGGDIAVLNNRVYVSNNSAGTMSVIQDCANP